MKRIIFKLLIIFIIIITLFEFIFSSNISNANINAEDAVNSITSLAGGIMSIIYWDKRLIATGLAFILDNIVANLAEADGINSGYSGLFSIITPFEVFFNKYKILDINFFDLTSVNPGSISYTIRQAVAKWFYIMRLIAALILLVILIYAGIRMAIASVAEEKAKYKKMLIDWCCSLLLIFVLQYIAIFTIYCNNAIVSTLSAIVDSDSGPELAIGNIITGIGLNAIVGVGITSFVCVLVFCAFVFQSLAFFVAYINRMIKVAFLIIISPLISLTYSIDKMGDGKAQALGTWLKEFIYTILIQPFHCIMYLAFIRTAFSLIVETSALGSIFNGELGSVEYNQLVNGVLAILCIKFVKDGEKIVRTIFGFKDDNSSTSYAGGLAISMMAIKNAQKIGTTTRKGINLVGNKTKAFSKAVAHDRKQNTPIGRMINKGAQFGENVMNKGAKLGEKVAQTEVAQKAKAFGSKASSKVISGAKTLNEKYNSSGLKKLMEKRKFGSLSTTLGIMGAAMAYMSGEMSGLEAFGFGKGISSGAAELFSSSKSAQSKEIADLSKIEDAKEHAALEKEIEKDRAALEDTEAQNKYANLMDQAQEEEEKADEADNEADALEEEAKEDRRKANEIKIQQHIPDGLTTPEYEEAKKKADEKYAQAKAKRAEAETLRESSADKKFEASQLDDEEHYNGRLSLIYQDSKTDNDGNKSNKFGEFATEREKELTEFYNHERAAQRLKQRKRGASIAELQAKKNEIISLLTQMRIQHRDGHTSENVLTLDEQDSIERTANWLTENIEYGVLTNNAFDMNNDTTRGFIEQSIGIKRGSTADSETFNSLKQATSDFESMQVNMKIAEHYKNHTSVGGDPDDLTEASAKRISKNS